MPVNTMHRAVDQGSGLVRGMVMTDAANWMMHSAWPPPAQALAALDGPGCAADVLRHEFGI